MKNAIFVTKSPPANPYSDNGCSVSELAVGDSSGKEFCDGHQLGKNIRASTVSYEAQNTE